MGLVIAPRIERSAPFSRQLHLVERRLSVVAEKVAREIYLSPQPKSDWARPVARPVSWTFRAKPLAPSNLQRRWAELSSGRKGGAKRSRCSQLRGGSPTRMDRPSRPGRLIPHSAAARPSSSSATIAKSLTSFPCSKIGRGGSPTRSGAKIAWPFVPDGWTWNRNTSTKPGAEGSASESRMIPGGRISECSFGVSPNASGRWQVVRNIEAVPVRGSLLAPASTQSQVEPTSD